MSEVLVIPVKLDLAGFLAEIGEFASQVEELILEAENLASCVYAEYECPGDPERWQDDPSYLDLVNLIDAIRPVVEKAKAIRSDRNGM